MTKNESKAKEVLNRCDWSASKDRFRLAIMVLQDKRDKIYTIYKDWPLFKKLREELDFLRVYKECYGETFRTEEEVLKHKGEFSEEKRNHRLLNF